MKYHFHLNYLSHLFPEWFYLMEKDINNFLFFLNLLLLYLEFEKALALNNLRTAIRNPKEKKEEINNKEEKSFTAKEINEVKDYIGDKIKNEEMKTNNKISNYLRKLN